MPRTVLATGGAGYIGSHVTVELIRAGYSVVILDNFENSDPSVVDRISELTETDVRCVTCDVLDTESLVEVLKAEGIDVVIHLAGKKSVAESMADPLMYFRANIGGLFSLLSAMQQSNVGKLVFSSSATVYGKQEQLPIKETASTSVNNPYGRTKLASEEFIGDFVRANSDMSAISLRYFNPVGADTSGLIGESPDGVPANLFPYISQTAAGLRDAVQVFGDDYDTPDGTGIRDYIHVSDLARGHVAAAEFLLSHDVAASKHVKVNLGTGQGYSVLEAINAFSAASGLDIPYRIQARRPGDVAASVADPSFARELLGWTAQAGLSDMCRDHWNFQQRQTKRAAERRKGIA